MMIASAITASAAACERGRSWLARAGMRPGPAIEIDLGPAHAADLAAAGAGQQASNLTMRP